MSTQSKTAWQASTVAVWSPLSVDTAEYNAHHPLWSGWIAHKMSDVFVGKYGLAAAQERLLMIAVQYMLLMGLTNIDFKTITPVPDGRLENHMILRLRDLPAIKAERKSLLKKCQLLPSEKPLLLVKEMGDIAGHWQDIACSADVLPVTVLDRQRFLALGRMGNLELHQIWPNPEYGLSAALRCLSLLCARRHHLEAVNEEQLTQWTYCNFMRDEFSITLDFQTQPKAFVS